jgi:hypothetical protein
MEEALSSIVDQSLKPNAIYVSLPADAAVPPFLSAIRVLTHSVDLGPIHKLLDCAKEEPHEATIIVTFDDDMMLDPGLAERLVHAARDMPDAAVGFSGWNVHGILSRQEAQVSCVLVHAHTQSCTSRTGVNIRVNFHVDAHAAVCFFSKK